MVVHDERIESVTRAYNNVLLAIHLVSDCTVGDGTSQIRMPERLAGTGVQGYKVVAGIARKHQVAIRAQDPRPHSGAFPLMAPLHLAGLVVQRLEHRLGPSALVITTPAFRLIVIIEDVVNAECAIGIYIEQAGFRTEAGRRPVDCPALIGETAERRLLAAPWPDSESVGPLASTPFAQLVFTNSELS